MARFRLWPVLLVFLLVAALLPVSGAALTRAQDIPPSYQKVAENDTFQLFVDATTLAFKVLDKRSNYLWHSGIDELAEGDRLNRAWRAFAQSGVSIEYLDERALNKRVSIANSPHILDVSPIERGVSGALKFDDYGISLQVVLQLEADGVRVEIPSASIREEDPKFRLGLVYLYPFLGATRGSKTPGYMFLPDGAGSIVRFADTTKAKNMYYGRVYGADLGMVAIQPWDPRINYAEPISYPVIGMVHGEGQNAYVAVVEKGAAYDEIQMHPAGIITNFNFIYNAFIYNQSYFQATNRSGAGVTVVQKQTNAFDAVLHYRFLTGEAASYVGMAQSYQQYLLDNGQLRKHSDPNPNIGISLEFLGGDKEKVLFWDRLVPMTTLRQLSDILDGLQIPNTQVIYYGWQPYGASTMPPTWFALEGGLGSVDELRALAEKIAAAGGRFSLYYDPQAAFFGESGYSPRNDTAMAITNISMEGYNRNYNYYFTHEVLQQRYRGLVGDMAAQLGQSQVGLVLDEIGFLVYSDFRDRSAPVNRETAIRNYQNLLTDTPLPVGLYSPNDYMFGLADAYYEMLLGDNSYIYTTEPVPFLPIVLAGYMPYYGRALNFSSNLQNDLLRQADYGIYPAYFLTHEPTANMLNTASAWIYTSSYAQWGEQVRQTYRWMNALLSPVRGQEIVARQELATGVFATTYANGKQIVVNYTDQPFAQNGRNGILVKARDAALVESTR